MALVLADSHALRYAGLAATILVLAFFSARRPALRIACVTAAIVILGDPRLGAPIHAAGYRMIEVTIGAVVSILTTLVLFPSRAGPAFADNVAQTLPPLFGLLASALHTALGGAYDAALVSSASAKVRANFAAGDALARESQLEVAGFLASQSDPDAVLRTLRRLWHTDHALTLGGATSASGGDRGYAAASRTAARCGRGVAAAMRGCFPRQRRTGPDGSRQRGCSVAGICCRHACSGRAALALD